MPRRRVPLSIGLGSSALLLGAALAMTSQALALAGDGSYMLVSLLGSGEVFATDQRFLGNLVRQAPVLAGLHWGVTDTHVLTLLLGVGLLVVPALLWSTALLLTTADRLAFTVVSLTAAICAGTTWFFSVSEAVMGAPLAALVAVLLWQPGPWRAAHMAIALPASFVLVSTYETALVIGPVLATWAVLRARRAPGPGERVACIGVATLAIASTVVSVRGALEPINPAHSRSLLYFVVSLDPWPLYVALLAVAAILCAARYAAGAPVRVVLFVAAGVALTVSVAGLDPSTRTAFAARGGATVAVLLLIAALWTMWQWGWHDQHERRRLPGALLAVPVAFIAGILAVNVLALGDWSRSLSAFREAVNEADGVTAVDAALPPARRQVLWNWTASSLSVVVRARADAGVLVDTDPSYVPFPPHEARLQVDEAYSWGR